MPEPPPGTGTLNAAVDVHYLDNGLARAAMVLAVDQRFAVISEAKVAMVPVQAGYEPGKLYLRELPPLRAVIPASGRLDLIVVDGYVDLDPGGSPGLGAHVHAEFGVPVIGVAKTAFRTATHAIPVIRGKATRPLYVTATGIDIADAARLVREMAGQFRVPHALKFVDRLARGLEKPDVAQPASTTAATSHRVTCAVNPRVQDGLDSLPITAWKRYPSRDSRSGQPDPTTPV